MDGLADTRLDWVGMLTTALLYRGRFELVAAIGATTATLVDYAHPVSTAVGRHLLLDEQITAASISGEVGIVVGVMCIEWRHVRGYFRTIGGACVRG